MSRVGLLALSFVVVVAFLLGRSSRRPDDASPPVSAADAPPPRDESSSQSDAAIPQRALVPDPKPEASAPKADDSGAGAAVQESSTIAALEGRHADNIKELNRVLREAGKPEVSPDRVVTVDDLVLLGDAIEANNAAINDAAVRVLDFMDPFSSAMAREIKAAVDAGKPVPYQVLPRGLIPKRGPYDLLATCAYRGVVYAGTMPQTSELFEIVDRQHLAENLRLVAYLSWVERLH